MKVEVYSFLGRSTAIKPKRRTFWQWLKNVYPEAKHDVRLDIEADPKSGLMLNDLIAIESGEKFLVIANRQAGWYELKNINPVTQLELNEMVVGKHISIFASCCSESNHRKY